MNLNLITVLFVIPIVFLVGFGYWVFTLDFGLVINIALGVLGLSLLSMYFIGIHCYNCLCRSDEITNNRSV